MAGLQLKTFDQVVNNMINWMKSYNSKITNFSVGSVVRTIFESVAIEIESMYYQIYKSYKYAIENAIYNSFGLTRNPAKASTGLVIITFRSPLSQNLTINKGFQVATKSINSQYIIFESTIDVVVNIGMTTIALPVQCTQIGTIGNVSANTITTCITNMVEIYSVTNNQGFYDGQDEESLDDFKQRFSKFIQTPSKATINALEYGCLEVAGVTGAVVENLLGLVNIYVHDSNGELPADLRKKVVDNLINYRAAGIEVQVLPVVQVPVNVDLVIYLRSDYDSAIYVSMIQDLVISFLNSFTASESLKVSNLIRYIMDIDQNAILDVTTNLPSSGVSVQSSQLIRAGIVNVAVGS
ncbi:MAG: baseplate J/gp47 family protein [Bacteroidota bacterium]|nr:baseplate J/gp47 family protein [Bacteroidota bacterium]